MKQNKTKKPIFFSKKLDDSAKNEKEIQIRPFVDDKNFKSEKFSQICLFCLSFFRVCPLPAFFVQGLQNGS